MTIIYHENLVQGSDEWIAARCGLLTASEMKLIITPTLKIADNDKSRSHLFELLAQRITKYVEPAYIGEHMLRGQEEEIEARGLYNSHYKPVKEMGFITNDEWGFTLGYSPDGLIAEDGLIEAKSRKQKFQFETIINQKPPDEFSIQIQSGLLVSARKWCDFISYSNGIHMTTIRVLPDEKIQTAIIEAATSFEKALKEKLVAYHAVMKNSDARLLATKRRIITTEITV